MLQETHPLGVMSLRDVEIAATEISPIPHKSNCFIVRRKIDPVSLFLSADTQEEKNNWVRYLGQQDYESCNHNSIDFKTGKFHQRSSHRR